jgi:hypothetical protein
VLAYVLLGLAQASGLALIASGRAGIWLQLAAVSAFGWSTDFAPVRAVQLFILIALGISAELLAITVGASRVDLRAQPRVGYGGLIGGGLGVAVGLNFPLLGSTLGALAGALAGTTLAASMRRGTFRWNVLGAMIIAMTVRLAAGIIIAIFTLLTLIR